MVSKLILAILFHLIRQLSVCLADGNTTVNAPVDDATSPSKPSDSSDSSCRNVFLAISLTSLFVYLLSLSMTDFISREKIPEVYSNKRPDKTCLILSKYLIKIVFGKWSSNLEFQNTLLNIEFHGQDGKSSLCSFSIPTEWLKKLMDHIGTRENPLLKAIKFWVYQPDSLGMISSVKIGLKDFKKTAAFIYIDSIEASKVSDDKIQVISIQKNVWFNSEQPLSIDLAFRQNTKVVPYDGYSPYFSFSDYFYFYIIYLDFGYFLVNLKSSWLFFNVESSILRTVLDSLICFTMCTTFVVLIAFVYLFIIKAKLSTRHNSETMQAINVIYLAALFIAVFVGNYLVCEASSSSVSAETAATASSSSSPSEEYGVFFRLLFLQVWFFITFIILWILNKIVRHLAMSRMVAKAGDLDPSMSGEDKMISVSHLSTGVSKPQSGDNSRFSMVKSAPEVIKPPKRSTLPSYAKKSSFPAFKKVYPSPIPKEESRVNRHDSENSIGSGYYHQMITATKHVRSISQYGELLKENKY